MKKGSLLFIILLAFCGKAISQVILNPIYGDPVIYTGWTLSGTSVAVNADSAIQLTSATGGQSGRVYYSTTVNPTTCGQFTADFDFRIQAGTGSIADGIAFWYLSSPVGAASTGAALDIPPNPNGLVLIMDTYDNNGDGLNPEIPLYGYNGTVAAYTEGATPFRLSRATNQNFCDNGAWHHCQVTYYGGAVKVYYDHSATALVTGTYPITLPGQFGFSGSTGGSVSKQEIKNVYIRSNNLSPITGTLSFCQGATSALSDSSAGGTWTSGNTTVATVVGSTGIVTGAGVGTATITYTFGTCTSTAVVTVNTQPTAILGTFSLCEGSTTLLTDATGGGVWSSTATTVATIGTDGTLTASGTTIGTSTISYLIGSCVATHIATVTTLPAAINGNTPICQGSSITLTDATGGGVWSSVTTTVATISTGGTVTASSINTGTSTVSYTIGSCAATATVTVNTQPTAILGSFSLCEGSATLLTDATSGGIWSSTATSVATIGTDGTLTASGTTTGTSTISYLIGSCVATHVVTVTTLPAAINGNTPICQGASITLTDATGGGVWSSVTTTVATISTGGTVTASSINTGTSTVSYTIGSCAATTTVTVNTQPTAILGTFSLCEGSATLLTDATSGGIWSSTATSVATIGTDGTLTASGTTTGTSTISYLIGSCVATHVVTVTTLPAAINGSTPICQGASITLTDATGGGVWSSVTTTVATISTGGTVTASSINTGTSTVSYTIGSCAATTTVTVNTQPTAILGSFSLCEGSATLLTDATSGGVWSSTTTSVATIGTDGTLTASGTTTGTSTISYLLGSCVATHVVTVTTLPAAINGSTPICQSASITLTDATGGGVWSSITTTVATISTGGTVTASTINTGTSTISYTIGSCAATTTVTVNTQPTAILGSFSLCEGSVTLLTDATSGGVWSSTTTSVATIGTDGTLTASGTTTGTSTISYLIGSCVATHVVTVTTLPAAINGSTPICQGASITLTDATGGGVWSSVTTTVATISTGGTVTASTINIGTSTISYTIGSCAATTTVTVNTQPTAILGSFSLCEGSVTLLTDATGGGIWSSTTTSVATIGTDGTLTASSTTTGTSTISYLLGSCVATQIVTVTTLPAAINGNTPICQGASITLTDATGGGVWSSVTTTVATISTGGTVTASTINTGTSTISYTIGSCAATTIVTVDLQPAIITGALSVCKGLTTALTDATTGGTWTSVTGATGTISTTGVLTGINSGTTTISYTIGICAAKAVATVNPLPLVINGTKTVCSGLTTTLSDATGGGTWSSSNTTVATVGASTGVVTGSVVLVTSTATITYTVGTGCIMTTIVTVNPLPTAILGANAVCLGSTTTLSDAGGGTWSSNNSTIASISSTGVVTGNIVGVTTITYTLPTGCHITAPMTVNPLPGAISGASQVCVGVTITLSDGTGGGTWSSSNSAIGSVAVPTTGSVTGVSGGTVTISYILNATGCYITHVVTVNAQVAVITPLSDTTFCPGGFVAITANTGAGYTYQWYVGSAAISGAVSSSYIATDAGSYQVGVTNTAGCYTLSIPMQVTIDTPVATLSITGGTTICAGNTVTMDANTGAGYSYQWLQDGVVLTGVTGSSYTTSNAGDYTVIVTNATGCSATSNDINISVNPSPTANIALSGPLTFCQGGSVVMTTDYGADYSYQWYDASGAIPYYGQTYTATATGTYYVIVSNSYGCTATSVNMSVLVNPLPDVSITESGSNVFCAGGNVTLSATAGYDYQWYKGGVAIAGATTANYVATTSGGYRVLVTDPATGCSDETHADTMVTEISTTTVVPLTPASFCWGGSVLLSTSVSSLSMVTYQWYFNGAAIPGATGPTYNTALPGNYSVQITIPGSCTMTTLSVPVTEHPLPDPIVSYSGGYFHTAPYYVTYQWYKDLIPIGGATLDSTISLGAGNYKVQVTDTFGCQSYSDVYVFNGETGGSGGTTGVQNTYKGDIKIYPNPAQTMVHIDAAIQVRAVITSVDGRTVLNIDAARDINISSLADGIYMIMLYDTNGQMVKAEKLVKASN